MTDFVRINQPRVEKILAMLDTIDKSARSQRVPDSETAALLQPIAQRLTDVEYGDTPVEDEPPIHLVPVAKGISLGEIAVVSSGSGGRSKREPAWVGIRKAAEEASLEDLTYAMAVYLNRIDEKLKGEKV
jgi:hypothetical protein